MTIQKQHFEEFKQRFTELVAQSDDALFQAVLWTDGELPAQAFQLQTVDTLTQLGPWGQKFPAPVFEGRFKVIDYRWLKEVHLKLRLALENGQPIDAIAFNVRDKFNFDPMQDMVRIVYELDKNQFNGNVSLQLRMLHLEQ